MDRTVERNCRRLSATTFCFGRRTMKGTMHRDKVPQRSFFLASGM